MKRESERERKGGREREREQGERKYNMIDREEGGGRGQRQSPRWIDGS